MTAKVRYLVFDTESAADGALVSKLRFPGQGLSPEEAVRRYRAELMEKFDTDFIPYTYQFPVAVAIAKVSETLELIDLVTLDEPAYRPHVITSHFWKGWEAYRRPTLVSFNGRTFDVPLLELAAFRYGLSAPGWFDQQAKTYEQPRNRYNLQAHLDLHDVLTNFGAARFSGGLNLAANLLGKPGKMEIQGHMVQELFEAGKLQEINDYCRCDVLDTYFVFLRCQVLLGNLPLEEEQRLVAAARTWIERQPQPAYQQYLASWGSWRNPWVEDTAAGNEGGSSEQPPAGDAASQANG